MGVPTAVDSDGGGGFLGDGGLCPKEAEYGRPFHRDAANSGPLRKDGAEAGGLGC